MRYFDIMNFFTLLKLITISCVISKKTRCNRVYNIAFSTSVPYTEATSFEGLIKNIFEVGMQSCCEQKIIFNYTIRFKSRIELLNLISFGEADFLIPVQRDIVYKKLLGFPFVPIIESPGFAFYAVPKAHIFDVQKAVDILGPVFIIMFIMTGIAGTLFWMAENAPIASPGEIRKPFCAGVMTGIWWALVTMTTVGYGDVVPKAKLGRILCVVWALFSIAFSSLFLSSLTTLVILSFTKKEIMLPNTEVAVLNDSEGYRYVAARQGIPIIHENIEGILESLHQMKVLTALVDTFIAGDYQDELSRFELHKIIEHPFATGAVFTNNGSQHASCVRDYIFSRQDDIYSKISKRVRGIKNKATACESSASLIDPLKPFFYIPMCSIISFWVAVIIIYLLKKWLSCRATNLKRQKLANNEDDALKKINDEYKAALIEHTEGLQREMENFKVKYDTLLDKLNDARS